MKITDISGVTRKDLFAVPFRNMEIEKGLNVRAIENYGNIPLLAAQIEQNGVEPLEVICLDNRIIVKSGHRRHAAIIYLIKRGRLSPDVTVNCFEEPKGTNEEQRIIDMLMDAEYEPLQPLDEATTFARLIRLNKTPGDIAKMIGKDTRYISGRLSLIEAPLETREALKDGKLSTTAAIALSKAPKTKQKKIVKGLAKEGKTKLHTIQKKITGKTSHISGAYVEEMLQVINTEIANKHTDIERYHKLKAVRLGIYLCRGDVTLNSVIK